MVRRRLALKNIRIQGEEGLGLVETLVAVAILGISVVAFIGALSAGSIAVGVQDEAVVAQSLIRSQMEYTKSYLYSPGATTYPMVGTPSGYSLSVAVSAVTGTDTDMQKITVIVSHSGQTLLTAADYKRNR